jgi:acyl-CoA thioesterase
MMASTPKKDEFAALLGIEVERLGPGSARATLATDQGHGNPHGTVHGAVFYAVAGAAIAAAANDDQRSGIVTSVLVEYLQPAAVGDVLRAEVVNEVSTAREDIFTGTVQRPEDGDVLAWVRARGTRRSRQARTTGGELTRRPGLAGEADYPGDVPAVMEGVMRIAPDDIVDRLRSAALVVQHDIVGPGDGHRLAPGANRLAQQPQSATDGDPGVEAGVAEIPLLVTRDTGLPGECRSGQPLRPDVQIVRHVADVGADRPVEVRVTE